jgi:hypothetical protein
MVLDKLIEAGFAVRCDKMHLAMQQVMYLGFLVDARGTRPHQSKTAALMDMTVNDMRSDPSAAARFAGMIQYYHKFIPNLGSILAPFYALKSGGADAREIMSSLVFHSSFVSAKYLLSQVTALARPDHSKPFYIDVDAASSTGVGAVLQQYEDEGDPSSLRPIAFWSRRFSKEERRYGVRDQECLGLVEALEAWRPYVACSCVYVRTDHKSLEWLLTTRHREGTRVSGFALKAQDYDVKIQWIPGTQNVVGDFFSRSIPSADNGNDEGERGRVLPPSMQTRPLIAERVEEAVVANDALFAACHDFRAAALGAIAEERDEFRTALCAIAEENGEVESFTATEQESPPLVPAELSPFTVKACQLLAKAVHAAGQETEVPVRLLRRLANVCGGGALTKPRIEAMRAALDHLVNTDSRFSLYDRPLGVDLATFKRWRQLLEQMHDDCCTPQVRQDRVAGVGVARQNSVEARTSAPTRRVGERAVVFVIRVVESGSGEQAAMELLVEEQDGEMALPSVENVDKHCKTDYRRQLEARLHRTYQQNDARVEMTRALRSATHRRSRRQVAQHFFVAPYCADATPALCNHTIRATFRRLDVALLGRLAAHTDREVAAVFAAGFICKQPTRGKRPLAALSGAMEVDDDESTDLPRILEAPFGPV